MSAPRFTIITVTYNRAALLREAILSVEAQGWRDFEHLIIDGASTDGTLEMLAQWPHLRVISEKDGGVYDAFNKGLVLARGEIIHFLNSDDLLVPGALASVAKMFEDEAVDLVSGGVEFFEVDANGQEQTLRMESAPERLEFSLFQVLSGLPAINARFFRRRVIERIGNFDLRYKIAADREYLVRLALAGPRGRVLGQPVYRYRSHGDSLTVHESGRNVEVMRSEHVLLTEIHLSGGSLNAGERAQLVAMHRRESAALAVDCMTTGRWAEAAAWAKRGWAMSWVWPLAGIKRLGGWVLGRSSSYSLAPAESN